MAPGGAQLSGKLGLAEWKILNESMVSPANDKRSDSALLWRLASRTTDSFTAHIIRSTWAASVTEVFSQISPSSSFSVWISTENGVFC